MLLSSKELKECTLRMMNLKFNSKFKYQNLYLASVGLVSFIPPIILPRSPSLFDWTLILTLGLLAPLCLLKPLLLSRKIFQKEVLFHGIQLPASTMLFNQPFMFFASRLFPYVIGKIKRRLSGQGYLCDLCLLLRWLSAHCMQVASSSVSDS